MAWRLGGIAVAEFGFGDNFFASPVFGHDVSINATASGELYFQVPGWLRGCVPK